MRRVIRVGLGRLLRIDGGCCGEGDFDAVEVDDLFGLGFGVCFVYIGRWWVWLCHGKHDGGAG